MPMVIFSMAAKSLGALPVSILSLPFKLFFHQRLELLAGFFYVILVRHLTFPLCYVFQKASRLEYFFLSVRKLHTSAKLSPVVTSVRVISPLSIPA